MDNSQIYFSLGSNVGDRKSHIEHALKHLDSKLNINAISSIYESNQHVLRIWVVDAFF